MISHTTTYDIINDNMKPNVISSDYEVALKVFHVEIPAQELPIQFNYTNHATVIHNW